MSASARRESRAEEDSARVARVQRTLAHASATFMGAPGVVSVGLGLAPDGREAIVIGLAAQPVDAARRLPEEFEGLPVLAEEVGEYSAE